MTNPTSESAAQEELPKCELCGNSMPPGETMFKYHGYSGPCPKPPLPQKDDLLLRGQSIWQRLDPAIEDPVGTGLASKWIAEALQCIATLKAENEKLTKLLDDAEVVIVRQRDARTTAQTQAAAMAGLLEHIRATVKGYPMIERSIDAALAAWQQSQGKVSLIALARASAEPQEALRIVNEQAEDDGLWFNAETAPEAYLQQELRRLHAAVERASAAPQEPVAYMWTEAWMTPDFPAGE